MRVAMLLDRETWRSDGRVRRELRALAVAGHDVVLLHRGAADADPALAGDGGRTLTVQPHRGRAALARVPWPLRRIVLTGCFAWRAARARPHAVHAHDLPMLPPAWLAARLAGAALVYDSHEYQRGVVYHGPVARRLVPLLERLLVPRCTAVVVVAEEIAALMREHYGVEPVVVANVPEAGLRGADADVADLRAELGVGDAPLLLAQGVIGRGRGGEELVDAVARLDGAHALFVGPADPGWADRVCARAREAGVAGRVHVYGPVALDALLAHTRQADVGLVLIDPRWASHKLAMPNKLFEYLVAGVPVVASAGTASAGLVTRLGVGWSAPFGDGEGLARVLATALAARGDPGLRERLAAAGERFTWERERERLLALYRSLAAARSSATRAVAAGSSRPPRNGA